jgi:plastocyanin
VTVTPTPTPTQSANEVDVHDNFFVPLSITVPVGATVTWTNVGLELHTISSNTSLFEAELGFRDSFSYTFTEPGRYDYHCMNHHSWDMGGTVIVE